MQTLRHGLRNLEFAAVADMSVVLNGDLTGLRAERHTGDHKIL